MNFRNVGWNFLRRMKCLEPEDWFFLSEHLCDVLSSNGFSLWTDSYGKYWVSAGSFIASGPYNKISLGEALLLFDGGSVHV